LIVPNAEYEDVDSIDIWVQRKMMIVDS